MPQHPFEMLEADASGILPGDEQLEGVLRGLPLVQEEPPELLFLDAGEGVVDDRQHEVHQEVEVDGEVPVNKLALMYYTGLCKRKLSLF